MPLPRIAIIGRPNVGKSSLLNMLARDKVSIVDDTPGTTRDRVSIITELTPPGDHADSPLRMPVEVTDTGGFGVYVVDGRRFDDVGADLASLTKDIEFQISQAVAGADLVLFVIDSQAGITAHDQTIARLVRERIIGARGTRGTQGGRRGTGGGKNGKSKKPGEKAAENPAAPEDSNGDGAETGRAEADRPTTPARVILIANKTDGPRWEAHAFEAAALGFGEPIPVSAKNNYFRREFLDRLYEAVAELPTARTHKQLFDERNTENDSGMRLAIVGKRNAGKSSLVNALAGAPRVIVSEIAGTTRDAVDVRFEMDGQVFTAIDTAGLRRKKSFADRIEWWAFDRAQRSIDRSNVVLMLVDATVPPSQVDQQLAALCAKRFKPTILVVNKWDLVEGKVAKAGKGRGQPITPESYSEYLRHELKALMDAPIAFISAKNRFNLNGLIQLAIDMHEQAGMRVGTGELNRLLKGILATRGPSSKLGTFAKAYFVAQVAVHPPTIVLVVNKPELFTPNYQRFLLNAFRKATPFAEVPIKLIVKKRAQARDEDLVAGAEQEERERRIAGRAGAGEAAPDADWAAALPDEAEAYFDDENGGEERTDIGPTGKTRKRGEVNETFDESEDAEAVVDEHDGDSDNDGESDEPSDDPDAYFDAVERSYSERKQSSDSTGNVTQSKARVRRPTPRTSASAKTKGKIGNSARKSQGTGSSAGSPKRGNAKSAKRALTPSSRSGTSKRQPSNPKGKQGGRKPKS